MTEVIKVLSLYDGVFRSVWAPRDMHSPWQTYEFGKEIKPVLGLLFAYKHTEYGYVEALHTLARCGHVVVTGGHGEIVQGPEKAIVNGIDASLALFWDDGRKNLSWLQCGQLKVEHVWLSSYTPEHILAIFDPVYYDVMLDADSRYTLRANGIENIDERYRPDLRPGQEGDKQCE